MEAEEDRALSGSVYLARRAGIQLTVVMRNREGRRRNGGICTYSQILLSPYFKKGTTTEERKKDRI